LLYKGRKLDRDCSM